MNIRMNNKQEYIEINSVREVVERKVKEYLKDTPTHWLFDGYNRFVSNISERAREVKRSEEISNFIPNRKEDIMNKWVVLQPVSFIEASRAWDHDSKILSKSDKLILPTTYVCVFR